MSVDSTSTANKGADAELAFDYIKADGFRSVWVDGVIGSLTPKGLVHFSAYVERPAIPQRQVFRISESPGAANVLGDEVEEKRVTRASIVRELSCDLIMTPTDAENLARWLLDRVQEYKQAIQK